MQRKWMNWLFNPCLIVGVQLSAGIMGAGLTGTALAQVPQISLPLVPSSAEPGSLASTGPGSKITVNGTGFTSGSAVYWNGSPRPTTFISSTRLTAVITAEDLESPGTGWVTVVNPTSGGTSNVAYFEITNPTTSVSFTNTSYAVGNDPVSVAVGDFNGDGRLDLAVTNYLSGTVSVLLGNGDGTFQQAVNYGLGNGPWSVAVGDFNGDGKLDLAVANLWDNNVSVLLGNGDGTFQPAANYGVANLPDSVAVGDFNGDGKLDLAVSNKCGSTAFAYCSYFTAGSVSILLGNGDGTFQPAASYGVAPWPGSVAVGDFNGDGKPDLAVGNGGNSNSVSVLLANGNGTFQAPINYTAGTVSSVNGGGSVAVGDFNGDGKLDLADTNPDSGQVFVLLGNGDGTFQSPVGYSTGLPNSTGVSPSPASVRVGDLNGDGKPDLLVANLSGTNVSVFLGNGDGTLQGALNYTVGANTGSLPSLAEFGDFNGDGRMDVALSSPNSNNVLILLQPTNGFAQLTASNAFSGNQTVSGTVNATSFVGNGSGLTGVNAATAVTASGLNCTGCVGNTQLGVAYALGDTQGGNAVNALALQGLAPSAFAPASGSPNYAPATGSTTYVAKGGDTMTGTLNLPLNGLAAGGNQFVLSGGNVGIGTTAPEAVTGYTSLHIDNPGTGFGGAFLQLTHSASNNKARIVSDSNGLLMCSGCGGGTVAAPVRIKAGEISDGTDSHIFIRTNGDVGIGTVTPAAKLDVNGTANFSGLVTFAPGQTFPGAGSGTITGVTAGTGLSGGGTSGNVSLSVDSTVARTNASNTFSAPQTINGALTATSFTGSGAALTNLPAGNLTGTLPDANLPPDVARLGAANSFTNAQSISFNSVNAALTVRNSVATGVLATGSDYGVYGSGPWGLYGSSTSAIGVGVQGVGSGSGVSGQSYNGVGVYGVTLAAGIAGAFNATNNGKILSGQSNGTEVFSVANNGSVKTSGSLVTAGPVTIGGGTAITEHISVLFQNVAFNTKLSPGACTVWSGTISSAADGDTVAAGLSSSLMSANIVFSAWATNGGIQVRICNPTGAPTTLGAGNIRIDVWRH